MAKKTVRELNIEVKTKGLDKAVEGLEKIDKSAESVEKTGNKLKRSQEGVSKGSLAAGKSFAKQSQGLGGLVSVYATVAANVFALTAAFSVLKRTADFEIMQKAMEDLSNTSGLAFGKVAADMKKAAGGALDLKVAMQAANIGLAGGASGSQLTEISSIATKAANALGRSVPDAVNRMIQAVTKGEAELVDEFGIILRVAEATEEYAAAHDKAASSLTSFERQQAIINQLLEQGNKKFGEVEVRTNPYERLQASLGELSRSILSFVSGPIGSLASTIADSALLMTVGIVSLVSYIGTKALPEFNKFGEGLIVKSQEIAKSAKASSEEQIKAIKAVSAARSKSLQEARKGTPGFAASGDRLKKTTKDLKLTSLFTERSALNKAVASDAGGAEFKAAANTTLKKVLTQINKQLKDQANLQEITISNGKKRLTITRDQAKALREELGAIKSVTAEAQKAEAQHRSLTQTVVIGLEKRRISWIKLKATMQEAAATSFASAGSILNASKFSDARKEFSALNVSMDKATKNSGTFTKILVKGMSGVVGGTALAVRGITGLASTMLGIGQTLAVVALVAVPLFNAIFGATDKHKALIEELDTSLKNIEETSKRVDSVMQKSARTSEEILESYKAQANVASDVVSEIKKSVGVLKEIDDQRFFSSLFNDSGSEKAIQSMKLYASELKKVTGASVSIEISGKYFGKSGKVNIFDLAKEDMDKLNDSAVTRRLVSAAAAKSIQELGNNIQITSSAFQDFTSNLKDFGTDSKKAFRSFSEGLEGFSNFKAIDEATNSVKALIGQMELGTTTAVEVAKVINAIPSEQKKTLGVEDFKATELKQEDLDAQIVLAKAKKELAKIIDEPGIQAGAITSEIIKEVNATRLLNSSVRDAGAAYLSYYKAKGFDSNVVDTANKEELAQLKKLRIAYFDAARAAGVLAEVDRKSEDIQEDLKTYLAALETETKAREAIVLRSAKKNKDLAAAKSLLEIANIKRAGDASSKAISAVFSSQRSVLNKERAKLRGEIKAAEKRKIDAGENELGIAEAEAAISAANAEIAKIDEKAKAYLPVNEQLAISNQLLHENATMLSGEVALLKSREGILKVQVKDETKSLEDRLSLLDKRTDKEKENLNLQLASLDIKVAQAINDKTQDISAEKKLKAEAELLKLQGLRLKVNFDIAELSKGNKPLLEELSILEKTLKLKRDIFSVAKNTANLQLDIAKNLEISNSDRGGSARVAFAAKEAAIQKEIVHLTKLISLEKQKQVDVDKGSDQFLKAEGALLKSNLEIDKQRYELAKLLFEKRREINELDQVGLQLTPESINKFSSVLGDSLSILAEDFTRKISSDMQNAMKILTGTVNEGVDALVDGLYDGTKSLGDVLRGTVDAINKVARDVGADILKEHLKAGIYNLLDSFGVGGKKTDPKDEKLNIARTASNTDLISGELVTLSTTTVAGFANVVAAVNSISLESNSGLLGSIIQAPGDDITTVDVTGDLQSKAAELATESGNFFTDIFSSMSDGFSTVFSGLTSMFSGGSGGGGFMDIITTLIPMLFAKGGIAHGGLSSRVPAYANGTITSGPELALIGEGSRNEAVIPLPDNRSVPVQLSGASGGGDNVSNITINISVPENMDRRSIDQLAQKVGQATSRAGTRNG